MIDLSPSRDVISEPLASFPWPSRAGLAASTIDRVPPSVRRPAFDVAALRPGILHLGCGAFHRAHQALLTQRAVEAELSHAAHDLTVRTPAPWGIVAASLVRPAMRDALRRQDGLYTVLERSPGGATAEVVGTLRDVLFAPEDSKALFAWFADPAIRIVTLTVTAEGYCLDPASGRLNADHPDIAHDLQAAIPSSAIGVLVAGLARVRASGRRPPVVLSCDNLAANGRTLQAAATDFAALQDDGLAAWIAGSVQFPCTVVDRIVPATTESDRMDAAALLGLHDAVPVAAEPFRQWVMERFDGPRPLWEEAGAEFVGDVGPWEASKLRLLNGTHMAIAYLGTLAGLDTVADVVAWPVFEDYALRFMLQEQAPTLRVRGHDTIAYAHQLLARWRNPAIAHLLDRVGRNGSQKLGPRLLASLRDNLAAGRPAPCTILAVAAWMLCASGEGVQGRGVAAEEAVAERLRDQGVRPGDAAGLVAAFLEMEDLFGPDLPRHERLRAGLVRAVATLRHDGPFAAVPALLACGFEEAGVRRRVAA